jgi:hypothetical protein
VLTNKCTSLVLLPKYNDCANHFSYLDHLFPTQIIEKPLSTDKRSSSRRSTWWRFQLCQPVCMWTSAHRELRRVGGPDPQTGGEHALLYQSFSHVAGETGRQVEIIKASLGAERMKPDLHNS